MNEHVLIREQWIDASLEDVFAFFSRAENLARITPPWLGFRIVGAPPAEMRDGVCIDYRIRLGPLALRWRTVIEQWEPPYRFVDRQERGPYTLWHHTHEFEASGGGVLMTDRVRYAVPLGALGDLLGQAGVQTSLDAIFDFRRHAIARVFPEREPAAELGARRGFLKRPRRIAVSGASGALGTPLCRALREAGHEVLRLVRRAARGADEIAYEPRAGRIDAAALEGIDALIHLAGASVAAERWSDDRKREILDSRRSGTALLANTVAGLARPPSVFVCASGVSAYGDRGAAIVDEDSPLGQGFLPDVCRHWEGACASLENTAVRLVHARIGVVLARDSGALAKMLPAFRLGVGGSVGEGDQWLSWIGLNDALRGLLHTLADERLAGAVNIVAPEAATNATLTQALGHALRRPTLLRIPIPMVRLLYGEMTDELLLASTRARPTRLLDHGFRFRFPQLQQTLAHELAAEREIG